MADRDLASDLEFWAGRAANDGAAEDPQRVLPSFRRRSWRARLPALRVPFRRGSGGSRARPIAAAVLLAGLTTAWLLAGHSHSSAPPSARPAAAPAPTPTPPSPSREPTTTVTTVARTPDCRGLSSARRRVRCVIDAIEVEVRLFTPATVAPAYRRATGTVPAARSGPPACAKGVADERAWSTASAPLNAVGRYRCRIAGGRAEMWWTRGDRLLHALARDADLGRLFAWWRAHPSE